MATVPQRTAFFRLWNAARAEVLADYGLIPAGAAQERDARHRWISEQTRGRTGSINAVRPGAEFARLMTATAQAAGDFAAAAYWSMDAAKRWRHMLGHLVRQLGEISLIPSGWEYVQGIFAHMSLPASWEDVPERDLESVFQMLDTHRRRLLKRDHGWQGLRKSDTDPLGFFERASYVYRPTGELTMCWLEEGSRGAAEGAESFTADSHDRVTRRVYEEVPA